jgi:hypothetical protein
MQKNKENYLIKSTQLILSYKKFEFRNNSIDSDEIIQSNNDQQLTSFDLMDFLPINSINSQSTQHQTNEQINIHENNKNQRWVRKFSKKLFFLFYFHLEFFKNKFNKKNS